MKDILFVCTFFLISFPLYAAEVMHIDNADLKKLIDQGVPVIDVRATSEWIETGVIDGSHLMMFYDETGNYDLDVWLNQLSVVATKDKPIILICHTGSRSHQLARYLNKVVGYIEVYNVKRGIANWIKQDNPIIAPN